MNEAPMSRLPDDFFERYVLETGLYDRGLRTPKGEHTPIVSLHPDP